VGLGKKSNFHSGIFGLEDLKKKNTKCNNLPCHVYSNCRQTHQDNKAEWSTMISEKDVAAN
jgi:hypothetical protein